MERPLLFAETPRAGRWNHRFLVPEDLAMSEEQLAEQAARARQQSQGANYLAVMRTVEQASGRTADELLVLQGIAVDRIDAATKRVLLKRLKDRLEDLQQLVEAIDWEQEGKRLVVRRKELTRWFDADFAEELAACRGPAPLESSGSQTGSPARRRFAMPLMGMTLAAIALLIWQPWSSSPSITSAPAVNASATPPVGAAELRETEPALRQLAERWRLPQRRDAFPELCEAVVGKLEADLAIDPVSTVAPIEQRLPDIVKSLSSQLMKASHRQSGTLRSHLEDSAFQTRLMSIYTGRELDYAAPLRLLIAPNDYDRQAELRALMALCPGKTKEQVRKFREIVERVKRLTLDAASADPLEKDTELVERLHDAARTAATLRWPAGADSGALLAVLNEQDAASAGVLLAWLGRVGFADTTGLSEEAVVAAVRRFVNEKRDFLEVLSTQDPPGRRVYAIRCSKVLLDIDQFLQQS